ncbi:MAG: dTDP-4-dehydrorhamnose 3,5-epimerase [Candidatus Omnitrophica bacterium]|nr:dTDP-4-dehydrorhamnose 3,5-epimerase [Candidatus Omnitrophota bacterium]
MKFIKTSIPGVIVIEPKFYEDARGFFFESYQKEVFAKHGIATEFVQDNHTLSAKGVLRGLHFQIPPRAQAKLVRVIKGEAFDVVVDVRRGSKTFGRFVTLGLSSENKKMVYVPVGFAHGYCALKDGTEFLYKTSDLYSPEHERGLAWDDPALGIPWPKLDTGYLLSDKDRQYPTLKNLEVH